MLHNSCLGIHSCTFLLAENDKLKRVISQLKKVIISQKEQIKLLNNDDKGCMQQKSINSEYKSVAVQTCSVKCPPPGKMQQSQIEANNIKLEEKRLQEERFNKMLFMYNNLTQRYEKEVKSNLEHLENINALNVEIGELKMKIRHYEDKRNGNENRSEIQNSNVTVALQKLTKEAEKLKKENKRLQSELNSLDPGFFDEVEDLKYALQQSTKLNNEYEKVLKKISVQFGLPFPQLTVTP